MRSVLLLTASLAATACGLSLRGHTGGMGTGSDVESANRWTLDLASLAVARSRDINGSGIDGATAWGFQLVTVHVPPESGLDVKGNFSCIDCDPEQLVEWVQSSVLGLRVQSRAGDAEASHGSTKHPNSPGYDRWQQDLRSGSNTLLAQRIVRSGAFFAVPLAVPGSGNLSVFLDMLEPQDVEASRPRLQRLWADRRLILGPGPDPLHQRLSFVDTLVHLARRSPALLVDHCGPSAPHCYTLISDGLRPSTTQGALYNTLVQSFGPSFLAQHTLNAGWSAVEQRSHVQALLTALKGGYRFYRQSCLPPAAGVVHGGGSCDATAASEMIGRIACRPEEDGPSDGCVYAELRRCGTAGCAGPAGSPSPGQPPADGGQPPADGVAPSGLETGPRRNAFFEYTRKHGPVALFQTRETRNHIMGQCEEFSRAAYAMLASLGYEARYVLDFTDHVWVEVRLPLENGGSAAWVHADPSEGVLDQPLIYEQGWGKNLTMIFAMTPWSIEHVTGRYTARYAETVDRRGISEEALGRVMAEANRKLQPRAQLRTWEDAAGSLSRDRSFADLALWSHFDGSGRGS